MSDIPQFNRRFLLAAGASGLLGGDEWGRSIGMGAPTSNHFAFRLAPYRPDSGEGGPTASGSSAFADGLLAQGPAAEYAERLMLYGQFVGTWTTETTDYLPDGSLARSQWDLRFAWVLEGRAIQDLWITPPRQGARSVPWKSPGNRYSTTLRVYDPQIDGWHILWLNPPSGTILRQLARKVGDCIIQTGAADSNGDFTRWVYRDITKDSFHWFGERSTDGGTTWSIEQEMRARRSG